MTTAIDAPGQTSSNAPRYLWVAVGLLGAATIAMGTALVYERTQDEPALAVAALAPEQTSALALAPAAKADSPVLVPKEAVAPAMRAQAAPKTIAKQASKTGEVVQRTEPARPSAPETEWLPLPQAAAPASKVVCAVCGTVESVTPIEREADGSGAGAAAGAVIGGLLGNQIGGAEGKAIATVIGALGGGWAGNVIEKRMKKETVYQVEVRMEDGSTRTVEQSNPPAVGARVTVEGNVISPAAPPVAPSGVHTSI